MCVVCNHRLKDIETLKAHVKLHESRPKWQCLICDKTYPGLNRLKMHTKIHVIFMDFINSCYLAESSCFTSMM